MLLFNSGRLPIVRHIAHFLMIVHLASSATFLLQFGHDAALGFVHVWRCGFVHLLLVILSINGIIIALNNLDAFLAFSHFSFFMHFLHLRVVELVWVHTLLALLAAFLVLALVHEFLKKEKVKG